MRDCIDPFEVSKLLERFSKRATSSILMIDGGTLDIVFES